MNLAKAERRSGVHPAQVRVAVGRTHQTLGVPAQPAPRRGGAEAPQGGQGSTGGQGGFDSEIGPFYYISEGQVLKSDEFFRHQFNRELPLFWPISWRKFFG